MAESKSHNVRTGVVGLGAGVLWIFAEKYIQPRLPEVPTVSTYGWIAAILLSMAISHFWGRRAIVLGLLLLGGVVAVWLGVPDYREWESGTIGIGLLVVFAWYIGKLSGSPNQTGNIVTPEFVGWVSEGSVIEQLQRALMSRGYKFEDNASIRKRLIELIRSGKLRGRCYDYSAMEFKTLDAESVDREYTAHQGRQGVEFWSDDLRFDIL